MKVLFLMPLSGTDETDVFAYFPTEMYSTDINLRMSYQHIGQHSACHVDYINDCREATITEYNDLYNELKTIYSDTQIEVINK